MQPIQTTPQNAINYIKTWIANNELEKAEQGIKEILEFDPNNAEAGRLREELNAKKLAAENPVVVPERAHRKISLIGAVAVIIVLITSAGIGLYASGAFQGLGVTAEKNTVETTQDESTTVNAADNTAQNESAAVNAADNTAQNESTTVNAADNTAQNELAAVNAADNTTQDKSVTVNAADNTAQSDLEVKTTTAKNPLMFMIEAFGFGQKINIKSTEIQTATSTETPIKASKKVKRR